jgi:chromosome partitioning protein
MDQALDQQLKNAYPSVHRLIVRQDSSLAWAAAERVPLMQYEPNSKGAKDLQAVADWVLNG